MEIGAYRLLCWDFDGVIKDSVDVKTRAFGWLFTPFGEAVARRVMAHHEDNGGMSRFEKMPLYLAWARQDATPERVAEFCGRFARQVEAEVVAAPWVPGAEELLRRNPYRQRFVVVSATPQEELEGILGALGLTPCLEGAFGAPTSKAAAIAAALARTGTAPGQCLMIGDAKADAEAAAANGVAFLLRRHASNQRAFASYRGESIRDFSEP